MKKGIGVSWSNALKIEGHGITISDEDAGHIMVAMDAPPNMEHIVIYCAVIWLTEDK